MRLVLAEDHQLLREGLRLLCERVEHWSVVGETGTCVQTFEIVQREQPDILLLDIFLSDGSAIDYLPRLRKAFQGGIVVLTGWDDRELHRVARERGADGIVVKGVVPEKLFEVIELVARNRGLDASSTLTAASG